MVAGGGQRVVAGLAELSRKEHDFLKVADVCGTRQLVALAFGTSAKSRRLDGAPFHQEVEESTLLLRHVAEALEAERKAPKVRPLAHGCHDQAPAQAPQASCWVFHAHHWAGWVRLSTGLAVEELEQATLELIAKFTELKHHAAALQRLSETYQYKSSVRTDFSAALREEVRRQASATAEVPKDHPHFRGFKSAVWVWLKRHCWKPIPTPNVHHAGRPMPGQEDEDIVMTNAEDGLLNLKCPLTGRHVAELEDPVRRHIYDKAAVLEHVRVLRRQHKQLACPVAGCSNSMGLTPESLKCSTALLLELQELRAQPQRLTVSPLTLMTRTFDTTVARRS
eukprot:SM000072S21184  [mRNA]  locus=s72:187573:189238:- [translate_table: standard]